MVQFSFTFINPLLVQFGFTFIIMKKTWSGCNDDDDDDDAAAEAAKPKPNKCPFALVIVWTAPSLCHHKIVIESDNGGNGGGLHQWLRFIEPFRVARPSDIMVTTYYHMGQMKNYIESGYRPLKIIQTTVYVCKNHHHQFLEFSR